MNKGQGCSTSEYKYVGSLQVTVMDDNAMFGEINKLGFRGYFVAECPNGHPYYVGEVSDAFTAILKVTSLKKDLYRGHQLYISVFMVYFYINVKSQVSLSPHNVQLRSLGLSGRCRDRIPYQATEYFSCFLTLQCGRPMEVKDCPECKVTIGGTEHKPFRGNTTAQR